MNEWTEFVLAGGLYSILLIISNVRGTKKIVNYKDIFNKTLGDNSKAYQESSDKALIRLEKVERTNLYLISKMKSNLNKRLEITQDELERQEILEELSTLDKL